jgi:hypothetical protein
LQVSHFCPCFWIFLFFGFAYYVSHHLACS